MYLSLRQGLGLGVGVVGIFLLTRLIGPTDYGLYRGALEIIAFFAGVARWGLDAFLVRREEEPAASYYHQVFSLLLVGSLCLMALGFSLIPLLRIWLDDTRYLPPLRALLLSLPLTVLSIPAVARLERGLRYRRIAVLETMGQVLYHGSAVLLAWMGWGLWGPVAGYVLWQTWMTAASWALAAYRPRWHWSGSLIREMVRFGTGYSVSFWVYGLRSLVNPIVIGRFLGPAEVGYVALSIRLVEMLGFVKAAAFRISMAALSRVQSETSRLRRAVEEAVGIQSAALGLPLAVFASISPVLLPRFLGDRWTPSLSVYPFVALGFLVSAVFSMHLTVLYVTRNNMKVLLAHAVHVSLFALVTFLFAPKLGILAYGLGEIAGLGSYPLLHSFVGAFFPIRYSRAFPWLIAFVPALFIPLFPWPSGLLLCLPAVPAICSSTARGQMRELLAAVRR
jgi:PST family polysaccharide transporter